MAQELVTISARIPKSMYDSMDEIVKARGYATRTELLREMIRDEILQDIESMRGALKGKVKFKGTVSQMMRKEWKKALKQAGGNAKKASDIMDKLEKEALRGLKF